LLTIPADSKLFMLSEQKVIKQSNYLTFNRRDLLMFNLYLRFAEHLEMKTKTADVELDIELQCLFNILSKILDLKC
jgi:hypothetical protein